MLEHGDKIRITDVESIMFAEEMGFKNGDLATVRKDSGTEGDVHLILPGVTSSYGFYVGTDEYEFLVKIEEE